MGLQPFLEASPFIKAHALSALFAMILGIFMLAGRKGGAGHRRWGYAWVVAMAIAASSSFFIHQTRMVGLFSIIHLLSVWALFSLIMGIRAARRRHFAAHRGAMQGLYVGGVMVAFTLSFMPDRMMNRMLFPSHLAEAGFNTILMLALLGGAIWLLRTRLAAVRREPAE